MHPSSFSPLLLIALAMTALAPSLTASATDEDKRIVEAFQNSYIYKNYLKNDDIRTGSENGVVTLSGTVAESSHKSMAEETASGLPGVVRVDDQLLVSGKEPEEHSDKWLEIKVKTALLFHANVSATGTTVTVKDGVVTLQGEARNEAQKELTEQYAKDVDGVKSVDNQMTVAKNPETQSPGVGEEIDDASITTEVKLSLLWHHSTSAIRTSVSTKDGVVTVGGEAKNDAEKSLVTKLASDIRGVKSVVNNMTVQGNL